jgi:16S rRNA (cytosine967-C5)-methyltransferase
MSPRPPRNRKTKPVSVRDLALQVLVGVQVRSAYSDKLEDSLAERHPLERRDRALLNELVKGTLKRRGTIDAVLSNFVHVGFDTLPPWIQNSLRLGAYQLLYLDRIPVHAVVSESVVLARKYGHPGTAGLTNSVLRRMSETPRQELLAPLEAIPDPLGRMEAVTSHPRWLLERWLERFSIDDVTKLAEANNRVARLGLRANRLKLDRKELIKRLEEHELIATPGRWSDSTVLVEGEIDLATLPLLPRGDCTVQDESETLVGQLVSPRPGYRVLDLCAAPGGKTTHLAELMADRGEIVAVDKHPSRARVLREGVARLGLHSVEVREGDAMDMKWQGEFHRVLVDAPCSGLGVLARRADARWRKKPNIIPRMAAIQKQLLASAASAVRRGGALVYSVCSFEPEETVDVISSFLEQHPGFRMIHAKGYLPGEVVSEEGALLCLPHVHGTDGVFAVRLERVGEFGKESAEETAGE